jgi:hypothetical protein
MPLFFNNRNGNGQSQAKIQPAVSIFPLRSQIETSTENSTPLRAPGWIEDGCYDSVIFPVSGTP